MRSSSVTQEYIERLAGGPLPRLIVFGCAIGDYEQVQILFQQGVLHSTIAGIKDMYYQLLQQEQLEGAKDTVDAEDSYPLQCTCNQAEQLTQDKCCQGVYQCNLRHNNISHLCRVCKDGYRTRKNQEPKQEIQEHMYLQDRQPIVTFKPQSMLTQTKKCLIRTNGDKNIIPPAPGLVTQTEQNRYDAYKHLCNIAEKAEDTRTKEADNGSTQQDEASPDWEMAMPALSEKVSDSELELAQKDPPITIPPQNDDKSDGSPSCESEKKKTKPGPYGNQPYTESPSTQNTSPR